MPLPQARLLASLSDELLARRAQHGDGEAFDALVARHARALLRFVQSTYPDRSGCEDIVQETFIAAWKALPTFGFRSQFRTWLYSLASRKTIDALRKRGAGSDLGAIPETPDVRPGPGQQVLNGEFLAALRSQLSRLPYPARAAWWLREVHELPLAEIAAILRTTEGSVRGHLQRTRKHLAEALREFRP
ncbi:RNA polymerase, sigma-24 subunit, ECF subfamily [Segniliparus rotundus DSM 44985]|uniref:RNA polymerase, sigma-24 subunit, ECF subfamily n=1 Tax=Segniliparus rotundus (strain ATCC BAA-972 / CDC 1076 / CIP 108378 / DSM 44985 / JCM 13578) TaxID=640132 RepID=D6ZDP2_SEGRD|nr:sigma-70 family RNA polymerase sigma factor [Segniliparus rotundus]ADG99299.1 RNA polymerase, sigma-24 subunit, ECF subfamily [Segniliparus rotundus DSM 44985]